VYKSPGFTLPSLVSGKMTSSRSSRTSKNVTVAFIFELTSSSSRCSNACSLCAALSNTTALVVACGATPRTCSNNGPDFAWDWRYAPPPTTAVPATMLAVISGGLGAHISCLANLW
jgi:hypothetical protein